MDLLLFADMNRFASMKFSLILLLTSLVITAAAQRGAASGSAYNNYVTDARKLQKPPVFPQGRDSLQKFYFSHFSGFDSLLASAISHGDTARYLRVYFTYVIDENGSAYEPRFERIASTQYGKSEGAKTIDHFKENNEYYQAVIREMIRRMPFWKPALVPIRNSNSMVAGPARIEDFIQFWVGINPPQY